MPVLGNRQGLTWLYADIRRSLEDQLDAMDDRDGWRERVKRLCALSTI